MSISAYYSRVLAHGWSSIAAHALSTVFAVIGTGVGVALLAFFQINPPNQSTLRTIAGIVWPLLLLLGYFAFYMVRAPWILYRQAVDKFEGFKTSGNVQVLIHEGEGVRDCLVDLQQPISGRSKHDLDLRMQSKIDAAQIAYARYRARLMKFRPAGFESEVVTYAELPNREFSELVLLIDRHLKALQSYLREV